MLDTAMLPYLDADDYDVWLRTGMALKHEGNPIGDWVEWSKTSPKYEDGVCEKKWRSFRNQNAGDPVTGGTIYKMAVANGYGSGDGLLHIGDEIEDNLDRMMAPPTKEYHLIDPAFVSTEHMPEFDAGSYDPKADMLRYLDGLFELEDHVGYANKVERGANGRSFPSEYRYDETYGAIRKRLTKKGKYGGTEAAFGSTVNEYGKYIRFNPLDGEGEKDANVTRYDYCLIESDKDSVDRQYTMYHALRLPFKFLVDTGGKSLHALVHVDAKNLAEYQSRTRFVYDFCRKNGLRLDEQDKNASRYTRLPGVMRGEKWQHVVEDETAADFKSFREWKEWVDDENDTLPEITDLMDELEDLKPLAPELIPNLLREGHKMLVAAPSKAGKSFSLMELAVDIAEGLDWMGFGECGQGQVLYMNMELDSVSCIHRLRDIYDRKGIPPTHADNVLVWNLRGRSLPLDKLAPIIVRKVKRLAPMDLKAVIVDPIYKVLTGDENSAADMSLFCNQFDLITEELGCAAVYCHHFSKGAGRTYTNAADMPSGSGVFARDPDAILVMRELRLDDTVRDKWCKDMRGGNEEGRDNMTAWEVSTTLREFPNRRPVRVMFDWPLHRADTLNLLANCRYADTPNTGVGRSQQTVEDAHESLSEQMQMMLAGTDEDAVDRYKLAAALEWSVSKLESYRQTGRATPWECATLGDSKVIIPRGAEQIRYNGSVWRRPTDGTKKWRQVL